MVLSDIRSDINCRVHRVICRMSPIILTLLLLVISRFTTGAPNEFQTDRDIEILSKATVHIIHNFYAKRANCVSLIRLAVQTRKYYKQSEIINRVLLHTKSTMTYVLEEPKYMKFSPFLRFHAVIFLDSYDSFR